MPGRSALALGAGFIALFAFALVLKSAASPEPEVPGSTPVAAPAPSAPVNDPWEKPAQPTGEARPAGRDPTIAIAPRAEAPAAAAPAPSMPIADEPELPGTKKPRLVANSHLRVQTNEVEPLVRACVERFGRNLTGTLQLTHIVVRDDAKQIAKIEASEVDPSESTIEHRRLIDCMRDTAYEMKFPYVADGVPVAALRKLVLDKGKMVGYEHVSSARIRD